MYTDITGLVPSSVDVSIFFIKIKVYSNYSFLMALCCRLRTLYLAVNHEFF